MSVLQSSVCNAQRSGPTHGQKPHRPEPAQMLPVWTDFQMGKQYFGSFIKVEDRVYSLH